MASELLFSLPIDRIDKLGRRVTKHVTFDSTVFEVLKVA